MSKFSEFLTAVAMPPLLLGLITLFAAGVRHPQPIKVVHGTVSSAAK